MPIDEIEEGKPCYLVIYTDGTKEYIQVPEEIENIQDYIERQSTKVIKSIPYFDNK